MKYAESGPAAMAKVFFTNVTETVPVGGTITGTLVVQSERPIDPMAIRVDLFGEETAFTMRYPPRHHHDERVGVGQREATPVQQTQRFLEASVGWENGGTEAGGFYRLPFSIALPSSSLPSIRTGDSDYVAKRVHRDPSFGMFVEYTLEGRVHHPMWADHVEYQVVHVVPPASPLGYLPNLRGDDAAHSLTLMVNPVVPQVLPGSPITGFYQVLNPQGTKLEALTIALLRRVSYSAQGIQRTLDGPSFVQVVEVPHREQRFAGQFSIPVPLTLDTIPPTAGSLFTTQWVFHVSLKGGILSAPIEVEAPLLPPSLPPPSSPVAPQS